MAHHTMTVTTNGLVTFEITTSERNEAAYQWGDFFSNPTTVAISSAVLQRDRIVVDPNILSGEPYIRGTRIPVSVILDGLTEGLTTDELIEHFPRLTPEDIRAVLEYAAKMALSPAE